MFSPRFLPALPFLALSLLGVAPAAAADVDSTAGYLLSLGGINIATADIQLTDAAGHYDVKADATVTGLGSMVASGTAKVEASGVSTPTGLASQKFDLETRAHDEDFSLDVKYEHGNVDAFEVKPPLVDNINRVPIERSQLVGGVGDLLSAFILKGHELDASLCNRHMHIFTGVERFDLAMSYLGDDKATSLRTAYQGPVVQCQIKYTPISGHFTTSEMTDYLAKSDRIFVWYAPMAETGFFIPYRVLLGTSVGDLSMVLTSLK
ncbi:MAG TPA: DUF3108 domain-containing protein [Devosiaceae bacterium]|nr:DUF3108 domain-containing protein [Devosiaceae bacterium]